MPWNDIDFNGKNLTVRSTYSKGKINSPKGGKERVLPLKMAPKLESVLQAYRTKTAERNLKLGTRWVYTALDGVNAEKNLPVSDTWIR